MAGVTTSSTVSAQFRAYFAKKLLSYAVQDTVLEQFAQKQVANIPAGGGNKSITMFRFGSPSIALVKALAEGTPLTAGTDYDQLALSSITKALAQYGHVIDLTDILTWTGLFNHIDAASKRTSQNLALFFDAVIRNTLVASNLTLTGSELGSAEEGAGTHDNSDVITERYGQGAADFNALNTATSTAVINGTAVLDCMTNLRINKAPLINGNYVSVVDPRVARDVMRDTDWLNASAYNGAQPLYRGEVGKLYNCRFVVANNAFTSKGSATNTDRFKFDSSGGNGTAATKNIFASLFLGAEAFSIPQINGSDPNNPQVNIVKGPDKSDPLNQHTLITAKVFFAALRQNCSYYLVYRSKTAYA